MKAPFEILGASRHEPSNVVNSGNILIEQYLHDVEEPYKCGDLQIPSKIDNIIGVSNGKQGGFIRGLPNRTAKSKRIPDENSSISYSLSMPLEMDEGLQIGPIREITKKQTGEKFKRNGE